MKRILCGLGFHSWEFCTCTRCGRQKDESHNWQGCKCATCGKAHHAWRGCKCSTCGKTRDLEHDWRFCKCSTCGKTRNVEHDWRFCKCSICSATRDGFHDWKEGVCTICGTVSQDVRIGILVSDPTELSPEELRAFTDTMSVVVAAVFGWPPRVTNPPVVDDAEETLAGLLELPVARIFDAQANLKSGARFVSGLTMDLVPPSEKFATELATNELSQWDEDRAAALVCLLKEHELCQDPKRKKEIERTIHNIGVTAYKNGWIFRMMLIFKRTEYLLARRPPGLEWMWNGIGSWEG